MPLPDFPSPPGNKNMSIHNVTGPTSYTQVTPGSPPTGGQTVNASDLGLVSIEWVDVSASDDGTYTCVPIIPSNPNKGASSIILLWVTSATGAQVAGAVNLSARTVRLAASGN